MQSANILFKILEPRRCGHIDAFFYSWEGGNALLVPPVPIASRVLVFMHSCKAQGTFVEPYWPSAPFRPLLISRFSASIKDYIVFVGNSVLMHGNNHKSLNKYACVNCYFWRLLRQVLAGWLGKRRMPIIYYSLMNYSLPGG